MNKFSSKQTLSIILFITFTTGLIGILVDIYTASYISTILFLIYASIYYLLTGFLWKKY